MISSHILYKRVSIQLVFSWLFLVALVPITLVFIFSFLNHSNEHLAIWTFTLKNYQQLFNSLFLKIVWRSLKLAFTVTIVTLFVGYPAAFIIARTTSKIKSLMLILLIVPFWTSSLIRTYALLAIIKVKGILNTVLLSLGLIHAPLQILYTNTAVIIALVYNLLPFMILPLFSNIEKLDHRLLEAARDLGANRVQIIRHITLPLTLPGIITGTLFVFLPAMTLFYVPDLLGGAKSLLMGNLIENQFLSLNDWPGGCATSILLTLLMFMLMWFYRKTHQKIDSKEIL